MRNVALRRRAAALASVLTVVLAVVVTFAVLALGVAREVPRGGIEGEVIMHENGRPLQGATVTLQALGATPIEGATLPEDQVTDKTVRTNGEGRFRLSGLAAGFYRVMISGEYHSAKTRLLEITEGKAEVLKAHAFPSDPSLSVYASQKNYLPSERARMEVHGFSPDESLKVRIRRIPFGDVAKGGGIRQVLSPLASSQNEATIGTVVHEVDMALESKDSEGAYVEPTTLPALKAGVYWVEFIGKELRQGTYLNVTQISLVSKVGANGGVAFATDLETGKPISAAEVRFERDGVISPVGRTDANGIVRTKLDLSKGGVLMATSGDSAALVDFYQRSYDSTGWKVFTYTERPVYRPGDALQFKTVIRKYSNGVYSLPTEREAKVEFLDVDGTLLDRKIVPISETGSLNGSFSTNVESKPGDYQIKITAGEIKDSSWVTVLAYRKPEFTVTVKPEKESYQVGDEAAATVECKTYFGAAVAGAKVSVSIFRSTIYSDPDSEEYWQESYGEYLGSVEAVTDETGRATIRTKTRPEEDNGPDLQDYELRFDATVNENDRYFDGSGSVKLLRGSLTLVPNFTESFVPQGKPLKVGATVRDTDTKQPAVGRTVTFELISRDWDPKTSAEIETAIATTSGTADEGGLVLGEFASLKPGSYVVRLKVRDTQGREIVTERSVYAEGAASYYGSDETQLALTLDKYSGTPGQAVQALIQTSSPGGSALVTVEGSEIFSTQVVSLDKPSTIVPIKLDPRAVPNAFVSVTYVHGKRFASTERRVQVKTTLNEVTVKVEPSKEKVKPGDTVTFDVTTLGPDGQPTKADVSVGVVDEAIYAIRSDSTDPKSAFYPTTWNQIDTNFSFNEIYLDGGDKGGSDVAIRRDFRDTAIWVPLVVTDEKGHATVSVKLPDNLTTWRATAVAITNKTEVGMGTAKVVAAKDLNLRIQSPRYLVDGDDRSMTVVINNETDKDQEFEFEVTPSQNLKLEGALTGKRKVGPKAAVTLEYTVKGQQGDANIVAKAWVKDGPSDGVESKFAVVSKDLPFVWTQTVRVKDAGIVKLPASVPSNPGKVVVTVTPSVATAVFQSLDDLVEFPYGCIEQTMSRFLPAILVGDALKDLGVNEPTLEARIPRIAADGLARIAKMQRSDGGWGWWEYDESDPFMTALVLDGLARAKASGYETPAIRLNQAIEWAQKESKDDKEIYRPDDRLYLAWVLAKYDQKVAANRILAKAKKPVTIVGHAYAALAYDALGEKGLANQSLAFMRSALTKKRSSLEPWGAEPEAFALMAMLQVNPDAPEVDAAAEAIMRKRRASGWYSTRDTAYSIIGLTRYMKRSGERPAAGTVTVELGGKPVGTITLTGSSLLDPVKPLEVAISAGSREGMSVVLRSDTGTPVTANVTYYGTEAVKEPTKGGFTVTQKFYRIEQVKNQDGTYERKSAKEPSDTFRAGEVIRCELTIDNNKLREYMMLEAYTPSNCSVVERESVGADEQWSWWYSAITIRDDRVAFFINPLQPGTHTIVYHMRAEGVGSAVVRPAQIASMYDPEEKAHGGPLQLKVTR